MDKKKKSGHARSSDRDYVPSDEDNIYDDLMIDMQDGEKSAPCASSPSTTSGDAGRVASSRRSLASSTVTVNAPASHDGGNSTEEGMDTVNNGKEGTTTVRRQKSRTTRTSGRKFFEVESDSAEEENFSFDGDSKIMRGRKRTKRSSSIAKLKTKTLKLAEQEDCGTDVSGPDLENGESTCGSYPNMDEVMHSSAAVRHNQHRLEASSVGSGESKDTLPASTGITSGGGAESGVTPASEENTDNYCWICHKGGEVMLCMYCPRVFHKSCVQLATVPADDWLCPECEAQMISENLETMSKQWRTVSLETLIEMITFLIDKLAELGCAMHFREPVDVKEAPDYSDYIFKPMDLSTLRKNTVNGEYKNPNSFLADFKWIVHNCTIFNGSSSPLSLAARTMFRGCKREITEMLACPDCYTTKVRFQTDKDPDPLWFAKLCRIVHPLVWVRLRNFPLWPAKVIAIDGDTLLARFFGDYDTNSVPAGSAYMHAMAGFTQEKVVNSRSERNPQFMRGYEEFRHHLQLIRKRYPEFVLPVQKEDFNSKLVDTYYTNLGRPKSDPKQVVPPPVAPSYQVKRISDMKLVASAARPSITGPASIVPNSDLTPSPPTLATQISAEENGVLPDHTPTTEVVTETDHSQPMEVDESPSLDPEPYSSREPVECVTAGKDVQQMEISPTLSSSVEESTTQHSKTSIVEGGREESLQTLPPMNSTANIVKSLVSKWEERFLIFFNGFKTEAEGLCVGNSTTNNNNNKGNRPSLLSASSPSTVSSTEKAVSTPPTVEVPSSSSASTTNHQTEEVQLPSNVRSLSLGKALDLLMESVAGQTTSSSTTTNKATPCPDVEEVDVSKQDAEGETSSPRRKKKRHNHRGPSESDTEDSGNSLIGPTSGGNNSNEVVRLKRELRRQQLLSSLERTEHSSQLELRLLEARESYDAEKNRVLEESKRVWEQEVVALVDAVKKKQWCSFCGREAFYYCCWNTCYCNSECQERHWATHMSHCAQAKRPGQNNAFRS